MYKKPTLKEEYIKWYYEKGMLIEPGPAAIFHTWEFFEPHLNKTKTKPAKQIIELPEEEIKKFNELWPQEKLPTGSYGRCALPELKSAFTYFFKVYPEYNDWAKIQAAARIYLMEREEEKWEWTRRSKYFIRREMKDKTAESLLADYYERILNGASEEPLRKESGFQPRVL